MIVPSRATAPSRPSRILVYGVTGSGKSTLAARISAVTGLPWHSVDDLTWEPGWVVVRPDEQRRRIATICEGDSWILDSGYGAWIDIPLARVQLIVALDYPRWRSFGRLLRRTVVRLIDRTAICNGNRETLRAALSRDSLLLWHCRSFGRKRRRIRGWLADPGGPAVQRFGHPREAADWLVSITDPVRAIGPHVR
ncbi:MAG TPA: hypothetical protein VES60_08615 [Nakamurella sp.]|nr:hypothetical protein [Nakamurella sp.]